MPSFIEQLCMKENTKFKRPETREFGKQYIFIFLSWVQAPSKRQKKGIFGIERGV
jgi:hypothetical protein